MTENMTAFACSSKKSGEGGKFLGWRMVGKLSPAPPFGTPPRGHPPGRVRAVATKPRAGRNQNAYSHIPQLEIL